MSSLKNLTIEMLEQWNKNTDIWVITIKNDMSILKYNKKFERYAKKFSNLSDVVTFTHKSKFISKFNECIQNNTIVSFRTNFSYDNTDVEDIPYTYNITMQYLQNDEIIIVAEPLPPLSHETARAYFTMINEYSAISRKLQKSEYHLNIKNMEITEKLKEIEHLANYDSLTKLYNRRRIFEELENEYKKFKRLKNTFSIVMIDIDDFKRVNDTYGHQSGDMVLQKLASLFKSFLRDYDSIGRFGGEEFLILFPNTSRTLAVSLVERIVNQISRTEIIPKNSEKIKITISAGVAQIKDNILINDLISKADTKLYEAKKNGKNQVCH